jgi:hypothetical protein
LLDEVNGKIYKKKMEGNQKIKNDDKTKSRPKTKNSFGEIGRHVRLKI